MLFISLSVLQIPIGWLRVNHNIEALMSSVELSDMKVENIERAKSLILKTDSLFISTAGVDPTTGKLLSPENYSVSDRFFKKQKYGEEIHKALWVINDSVSNLPDDDRVKTRFNELFVSDIINGLAREIGDQWITWKFEHVPATVAHLLLNDLHLKLNLLKGEFHIQGREAKATLNFILDYNLDNLQVGDTAYFVYLGLGEPILNTDSLIGQDYRFEWKGDSLLFVPLNSGPFILNFKLSNEGRTFNLDVLPESFESKKSGYPLVQYAGLPIKIPLRTSSSNLKFDCSCSENLKVDIQNDSLFFRPINTGWCKLLGYKNNRSQITFLDSIFIQELPTPLVYVDGISGDNVSRKKLKQLKSLEFVVQLPEQEADFDFSIKSIEAKLHTRDSSYFKYSQEMLSFTEAEIDNLFYIEIQKLIVNSVVGETQITDRLIINVKGDD